MHPFMRREPLGESAGDGAMPPSRAVPPSLLLPSLVVKRVLAWMVIRMRGWFGRLSDSSARLGHYGLVAGVLAATLHVIVGVDSFLLGSPLRKLLVIVALPVLGAIGQFAAESFSQLCERVVRNTTTRASSLVLFQFTGLLLITGSALLLMVALLSLDMGDGVGVLQQVAQWIPFMAIAFALFGQGLLCIDAEGSLNLRVQPDCSAGEDGIGLIGTLMKANLASARLVFGVFCTVGGVASVVGLLLALFSQAWRFTGFTLAASGVSCLAIGAFMPMSIYMVSVLYYILIDALLGLIGSRQPKA